MFTLIIYTGYVIEPNVTRTVGRPYDYPFYIDYLLTFQSIKLLFVYTTVTNFFMKLGICLLMIMTMGIFLSIKTGDKESFRLLR